MLHPGYPGAAGPAKLPGTPDAPYIAGSIHAYRPSAHRGGAGLASQVVHAGWQNAAGARLGAYSRSRDSQTESGRLSPRVSGAVAAHCSGP